MVFYTFFTMDGVRFLFFLAHSTHEPRYEALRMEVAAKLRVRKLRILVGKTYEGWIDLGQVMFGLKWAFFLRIFVWI